tara:strand:+ start:307 stop:786 length:480 start_codon:yes stop_codon:yes gene_type:complete
MSLISITEEEVLGAQEKWAKAVIDIGNKFIANEDHLSCTEMFLDRLYAFSMGDVLFKPTLVSQKQFRLTKKGALSYFIGGDPDFPEDTGFALKKWKNIRFENKKILIEGNIAIAMGNYFMTVDNFETKIEYSLVYKKDPEGNLRIILHDSHLPYNPEAF